VVPSAAAPCFKSVGIEAIGGAMAIEAGGLLLSPIEAHAQALPLKVFTKAQGDLLGTLGKRRVTPDTAMCFEQPLGSDAQSWLNLQTIVDLYDGQHSPEAKEIRKIKRVKAMSAA
jgi:plasmid maintenance system antidote protein VapI